MLYSCNTQEINLTDNLNSVQSLSEKKQKSQYSAKGNFRYKEMVTSEDIDIHGVANQFLWNFEPKDVESFDLRQMEDNYPMRSYEITFYGSNESKVTESLKKWQLRFAEWSK